MNDSDQSGHETQYVKYAEIELPNMPGCSLIITPALKARIAHPGCMQLADISVELDAFYCIMCRFNGRVSGYWVISEVEHAGNQVSYEQPFLELLSAILFLFTLRVPMGIYARGAVGGGGA